MCAVSMAKPYGATHAVSVLDADDRDVEPVRARLPTRKGAGQRTARALRPRPLVSSASKLSRRQGRDQTTTHVRRHNQPRCVSTRYERTQGSKPETYGVAAKRAGHMAMRGALRPSTVGLRAVPI